HFPPGHNHERPFRVPRFLRRKEAPASPGSPYRCGGGRPPFLDRPLSNNSPPPLVPPSSPQRRKHPESIPMSKLIRRKKEIGAALAVALQLTTLGLIGVNAPFTGGPQQAVEAPAESQMRAGAETGTAPARA